MLEIVGIGFLQVNNTPLALAESRWLCHAQWKHAATHHLEVQLPDLSILLIGAAKAIEVAHSGTQQLASAGRSGLSGAISK